MSLPKSDFLTQLRSQLEITQTAVVEKFVTLTAVQLNGSPAKSEWSMLQCIEHLNLTHAYYRTRIEAALRHPVRVSNPWRWFGGLRGWRCNWASRLGISPLVIGLTVVFIGTGSPEIAVGL